MSKLIGGLAGLLSVAVAGVALFASTGGVLAAERDVGASSRTSLGLAADQNTGARTSGFLGRNGEARGGRLGLSLSQLNADLAAELDLSRTEGVVVRAVAAGSVAESAGFQTRDVILTINGAAVTEVSDVREIVGEAEVGSNLQISVARGSQTLTLTVTVPEGSSEGGCSRPEGSGASSRNGSGATSTTRFARLGR